MKQNMKNTAVLLMAILAVSGTVWAGVESVRITSARKTIEVGEPLAIEVTYKYQQPIDSIRHPFPHTMRIVVEDVDGLSKPLVYTVFPDNIRQDSQKGEFTCSIELWCNGWGENPFKHIFTNSGKYKVFLKDLPAKVLSINVIPSSDKTKKAIALLNDPNDMPFLLGMVDTKDRPARMAKLTEIAKKCDNTVIGQIAAGRLGIEYFKDFHKKHPSREKFRNKRRKEGLEEPLLDEVDRYLKIASKLPDDMQIREEVIYRLAVVQFLKDDLDKASTYIDELIEKYTSGQYGKKAAKGKDELEEIKKRESEQLKKTDAESD